MKNSESYTRKATSASQKPIEDIIGDGSGRYKTLDAILELDKINKYGVSDICRKNKLFEDSDSKDVRVQARQ